MPRIETRKTTVHPSLQSCTRALLIGAALGLPLSLAAPAAAQCTISRAGTPDFDQRRAGLPNDGAMYCVPTSIANFVALLSNSGYPNAFNMGNGNTDWQSNYLHQVVTTRIGQIGVLMGTHALNGTNLVGAVDGAQQWLNDKVPGEFIVLGHSAYLGHPMTPKQLYTMQKAGAYIAPGWGRYEADGVGLTRTGGHVVSMTQIRDACTTQARITWRDPDDAGGSIDVQSWFSSRTAFLNGQQGLYRSSSSTGHTSGTLYAFSHASNRFLDNYIAIKPLNYSTPSQMPGEVLTHNPVVPAGLLLPAVQQFQVPGDAEVVDVVNDPRMLASFISTAAAAGSPERIWKVEEGTAIFRPLHTPSGPALLTTGRFGELFILDGRSVIAMDPGAEPPATLGSVLLPAIAQAIAYDDSSDMVLALGTSPSRIMRIDRGLVGPPQVLAIPSAVPVGADPTMAIGPTGLVYLASAAADAIYELKEDPAAGSYTLKDVLVSSLGAAPQGVQVDSRGNIFFILNGQIQELEKNAAGQWVPAASSILAGKPAHRRLSIPRSRHNFDLVIMSGPEFYEIGPEDPAGIPDCYANCDGSTASPQLNVDDFTCFINAFAGALNLSTQEQILHYANCDESTSVPVLNVDDFTCFINAFASGCP